MKFVWFSDVHVQNRPPSDTQFHVEPFWAGGVHELFDRLARLSRDADAFICSGDASHNGHRDEVFEFFLRVSNIAENRPVMLTLGNHDVVDERGEDHFREIARQYPNFHVAEGSFPVGEIDVILANNLYLSDAGVVSRQWSTTTYPVPAMTDEQVHGLDAMLGGDLTRAALVVVHCPSHVLPPDLMVRSDFVAEGSRRYADSLHGLLGRHPRVRGVLSGHVHVNTSRRFDNGRVHQTVSSFIEYPFHVRIVESAGPLLTSRLVSLAEPTDIETRFK